MDFFLESDWRAEKAALEFKVREFYHNVEKAKRLTFDPFLEQAQIRCTSCKTKTNYFVPSLDKLGGKEDILEFVQTMIATANHHPCLYRELEIRTSYNSLRIFGELLFCEECHETAPLKVSSLIFANWSHQCKGQNQASESAWHLNLGKKNILLWIVNAWVLEINFHQRLWASLKLMCYEKPNDFKYDKQGVLFILSDNAKVEAEKLCNAFPPSGPPFRCIPKPQPRQAGAASNGRANSLAIGRKAKAAHDLLEAIPSDLWKKVYRMICLELHPDKHPENAPAFDKQFRIFQEKWNSWNKS